MTRTPAILGFAALLMTGCVTVVEPQPSATPRSSQAVSQAPTPTPVPTAHTYRIRAGDNLHAIAQKFGLTIGQLLAANPDITDPNRIKVGQALVIPPPDAPDTGPDTASIGDGSDDAIDPDGQLVTSQAYADLTGVQASLVANRRLQIDLELVNGPPARLDPEVEVVTYTVVIDIDGDGQPDFKLLYSNDIEGESGFASSLENRMTGQIQSGDSFPGSVSVKKDTITFVVRRAALGTPRAYALAATVERIYYPGGRGDPEVLDSVDNAPDQQWPRPNPRWIEVGGVCGSEVGGV
ncbi:MAG: LysM peptidoglycan-binding domain-containing protein [Chloroflexi bacterium]|nr:LysM peptidoglycan-binding domain-containing protein [Chloroflexota bacterium]